MKQVGWCKLRALLLAIATLATLGCSKDSPTTPTPPPPPGPDRISGEVIVTLAVGADPAGIVADYSATLLAWEDDERQAAFAPPSGVSEITFVASLRLDARVITAEQNSWLETAESRQQSFAFDDGLGSLTNYQEQSVVRALGLGQAHALTTGSGVVVAVLDSGVDPAHPALASRLLPGYDFVDADTDPSEVTNSIDDDGDGAIDEAHGHGSHVAGLVALVAPGASIMPVRVLDADGRGDILAVAAAIRWAVAQGVDVINMSLGMLSESDAIEDALDEASDAGIIVVASVGNWGAEQPREYPAKSSEAIAVAASDTAARPAPFTSFANYVEVSAPGIALRSAYPGGGYRLWTGTSMSAPLVSGAIALLLARDPGRDEDAIRDLLQRTSTPLVGVDATRVGKLGTGMLHVGSAVAAPVSGGPAAVGSRALGLSGSSISSGHRGHGIL